MDPLLSPNESFFYDRYLEGAWRFHWLGVVLLFSGLIMAFFAIAGVILTFCFEMAPKRLLEDQFARLRDHKVRDPICHMKGRMLGVKTQDWKDYFSMPAQMLPKKQKKLIPKTFKATMQQNERSTDIKLRKNH